MIAALFQKKLLALQNNLLSFAIILTSNRDDAYDLLQDTVLKALDNKDKYMDNTNFKGGCSPSCVISSLTIIAGQPARRL